MPQKTKIERAQQKNKDRKTNVGRYKNKPRQKTDKTSKGKQREHYSLWGAIKYIWNTMTTALSFFWKWIFGDKGKNTPKATPKQRTAHHDGVSTKDLFKRMTKPVLSHEWSRDDNGSLTLILIIGSWEIIGETYEAEESRKSTLDAVLFSNGADLGTLTTITHDGDTITYTAQHVSQLPGFDIPMYRINPHIVTNQKTAVLRWAEPDVDTGLMMAKMLTVDKNRHNMMFVNPYKINVSRDKNTIKASVVVTMTSGLSEYVISGSPGMIGDSLYIACSCIKKGEVYLIVWVAVDARLPAFGLRFREELVKPGTATSRDVMWSEIAAMYPKVGIKGGILFAPPCMGKSYYCEKHISVTLSGQVTIGIIDGDHLIGKYFNWAWSKTDDEEVRNIGWMTSWEIIKYVASNSPNIIMTAFSKDGVTNDDSTFESGYVWDEEVRQQNLTKYRTDCPFKELPDWGKGLPGSASEYKSFDEAVSNMAKRISGGLTTTFLKPDSE